LQPPGAEGTLRLLILLAAILVTWSIATVPASAESSAPPAGNTPPAKETAETPKKAPETPGIVRYANDKVTVDVEDMPAAALIDEIARQAGAKVTGGVGAVEPVTATWTDLPLKEALEHVLGQQNFTLTYSEQGALRVIQLRGVQREHETGPAEVKEGENRVTTSETALFKAFDIREPVPVQGAIAKRLGKSMAPWDLLTNTAYADEDPAVRRSAVKSGMEAFEGNEELRDKVINTTNGMTDAQLAAFARAYMYHRAEDFVRNVKRATTLPDVRHRAANVLRELRKIPFTGPKPVEGGGAMH
jgi:hypothetical protein